MNDDEMSAEEFDARAAAGESVQLNVTLTRPSAVYSVTLVSKTGVSAARVYGPVMTGVTETGLAPTLA